MLGYTLSGIRFSVEAKNLVAFEIREDSGGQPVGSLLATLSGNANAFDGNILTAPAGVTLNPNTTYWLIFSPVSTATFTAVRSDRKTGLTGWTLGNASLGFSSVSQSWVPHSGLSVDDSFKIAVRGYTNLPTTIKLIHTYDPINGRDATVEGSPVPVVVSASKCPPLVGGHGLTIPLKMTTSSGQTAEIGEDVPATFTIGVCHAFGSPAWYRRSSTVAHVPTYQDGDSEDETFTISLDLDKLPADIAPDPSWAAVAATIRDDDSGTVRIPLCPAAQGGWFRDRSLRCRVQLLGTERPLRPLLRVHPVGAAGGDPLSPVQHGPLSLPPHRRPAAQWQAVEYDDDGGRGYASRIRRTLEAGTYTIEATTFNPGTGNFTLTLFGTGGAASSPSQPSASAQPAPAPTPALRVADAQAEGGNPYNEGEMHFTVTLSPAATHEVAVSYTTRDGTASGDLYGLYGDYEEEYGRMSFAPGETRKTVRVRLIGDWHDEGPETFSLVLSNPQGAPRRWGRCWHHHQRRPHPCRMERSFRSHGGRSGAGCGGGGWAANPRRGWT